MQDHGIVRHEPSLFSPLSHDSEPRKPSIPIQQQNVINNSKRASKGSIIFSWFSRETLPAKYKKGTTQLSAQLDKQAGTGRDGRSSGQSTVTPSLADDLGLGEDLHSYQSYRFAKIIQQIDKAIISVSPDVCIPPPHLLLRLRNEEAIGPDSKRKSYTWEDVEFVAKKIGFGNRMGRPKMSGALGQVTRFGTTTSTATNQTNATGKGDRLPIDSRAGLDHLMTNGNALQGIFNHQFISFSHSYYWSATAAAPCELPKVITMEYYRKEGAYEDMDLGEMIEYLCRRALDPCQDKKCGHKRLEHISTYAHGEARINITLEQPRPDSATDFDSKEFAPFLANNKTIAVWTRCKMCKARTKPRMVSRASRIYSFGKYLELLLYNQHFEPGPRPLCDHALSKDAIARCFLYRKLVVNFEVESIDLFEMRISRLQVREDFPTMPRLMVSMSAHCDYITDAEHANQINATRLEIMHFYESCKKIIVAMEEHFGETKSVVKRTNKHNSSTRTTTVDPAKKAALTSLDDLGSRWKADEFELYDQLKRIPITRLNDLRNRFKDYIKRTMRSMESWQTEHYPDLAHSLNSWTLPEYVTSDILHTFPRSSVIVRENEPSSIIASTLSGTMKGLSLNALSEKIGSGFTSYGASSANIDKADKEFFKADGTERTMRETLALEQELESSVRSPHLKARFSHGKTSFSCTVYYAAEFDTLRRRCGIHQNYVQSLSRCKVWNANGGKSKSSFYKTKDDRFVVKQMVSSWNIAEKDELLKFAPKYFDYMEKTHEAPTVLAKIFGFYTFKIKNGQSGQVMKIDVLVMEHLFFNQKITRTFDLKGIQDRHAGSKPNTTGGGSTTLWDGDFIEGRYKALLLIHSHSKKIIRESLLNDTEFLAAANIMDYSLLVGVDDERKELVVGIVDFIGAYTWYKRIESKGKTTLRGAKDNVTVLPPQQYKTRFREAMERYFLAVPGMFLSDFLLYC
ncbi:MAG: hypothetical protein J3R72DRAFT_368800 [Linnemannia gamsii]|nr:MAG: hypothetical protein J3R72DRAFT_368800 [Linnemannia gamsii]